MLSWFAILILYGAKRDESLDHRETVQNWRYEELIGISHQYDYAQFVLFLLDERGKITVNLDLKDYQITINGFASRCHCKCKYCLLCSGDEKIKEVPFEKLKQLALKFRGFKEKYEINASLCVYNCSEYPELAEAMKVDKEIAFTSGYQNLNGTKIRKGAELKEWVNYLKSCGVKTANITWFGESETHDKFVNRKGYFEYLIDLVNALKSSGIPFNNMVVLYKSSMGQLEQLIDRLNAFGENIYYSLIAYRGNGKNVLDEFLVEEDKTMLPQFVFNTNLFDINRPEYEWIKMIEKDEQPKLSRRMMFLVATPDNIDSYMQMTIEDILDMFHDMDFRLQSSIPSIKFLSETYGNRDGTMLSDFRSILWKWTDAYFNENPKLDKTLLFSDLHTSVMWR